MDLLTLLHHANSAGLKLSVRSGRLVVEGPDEAGAIAESLGARKEEVVSILGMASALTGATSPREPIPCREEPHVSGASDRKSSVPAWAETQGRFRCLAPYCLHKGRWWMSAHRVVNCGNCRPPAFPDLVVAEGDATDAPFVEPDRSNQAIAPPGPGADRAAVRGPPHSWGSTPG
jgi:hypothetical protein